jgi:16S rRNA (adenine1518-N6/adenine1519-N6)-dimethyltransferase
MKMKIRSGRQKGRGARLGQHFLVNPVVARTVAEGAGIAHGVSVLEIGPGTGALTSVLLALGAEVTAIEKDGTLVARLKETFADEIARGQLRLIEADVRDVDPRALFAGPYVLAANIPYYITGEIIRRFLTASHKPQTMSLLMQKEVAERIVARDHKESLLSLSVKAYGTPRVLRKVPPGNFAPPPSVDSAVLQISGISGQFFKDIDESRFFELIRAGFSSKRKLLAGNLRGVVADPPAALAACGIAENARAEDLPLEAWQKLVLLTARG